MKPQHHTILVFVDGIGLGTPGAHNPFDHGGARTILAPLAGRGARPPAGWTLRALDARLGVEGLPQSATGTATILTGTNVAKAIGEHLFAFPDRRVRAIIDERSILLRARQAGATSAYLNAFTHERARDSEDRSKSVHRGACTCAAIAGGGRLYTVDDLHRAATFDLVHDVVRGLGIDVAPRSMLEAARAVLAGAREVHLSLFELFLTDKAGHAQDTAFARREVARTERFLEALASIADPARDTLVVASDHGNLDDLSTRGHTMAPVPALAWGRSAAELVRDWSSLEHIGDAVLAHALS